MNDLSAQKIELAQLCLYSNYPNQQLPNGWVLVNEHIWYGERERTNEYQYKIFDKGNTRVYVFVGNDLTKDLKLLEKGHFRSYLEDGCRPIEQNFTLTEDVRSGKDIIFSGYSSGAALAEIACGYYSINTLTFESPGCLEFLEKRAKDVVPYRNTVNDKYFNKLSTLLTKPNSVNTLNKHFGKVYRLRLQHTLQTSYWHMTKAVAGEADRLLTYISLGTWAFGSLFARTAATQVATTAASQVATTAASQVATTAASQVASTPIIQSAAEGSVEVATRSLAEANKNLFNFVRNNKWREYCNNALYWRNMRKLKLAVSDAQNTLNAALEASRASAVQSTVSSIAPTALHQTAEHTLSRGAFFSTAAARVIEQLDDSQINELLSVNQHGLDRIIEGLTLANSPLLEAFAPGSIFEMDSWPATQRESWSKFALDIIRSKLPGQACNAGLHNILNEDAYIEGNIGIMDGYTPKTPTNNRYVQLV